MMTTFEGIVVQATGAAVQFHGVYWDGPLWFPTSQVTIMQDGDIHSVLQVKDWLAKKRGLLEFTHYSAAEVEAMNAQ